MRCKAIVFILGAIISMGTMTRVNKIEILSSEVESQYTSKFKLPKKIKPKKTVKKVVKKSKKEKELEYWSEVTGRKVAKVTKINARLSFYTDLDCENYEGCGGLTASGVKLYDGVVANNSLPLGTNMYIEDFGEYKILDRGGRGLYGNNFDVYIPRNYGESDTSYYNRIQNLGVKNKTAWILEFAE